MPPRDHTRWRSPDDPCYPLLGLVTWHIKCATQRAPRGSMSDIVDSSARSRMMAAIRGRDTKPEILVRAALHARGFRFGVWSARLPGRPDIVLPKWKVALFVQGCFWHWHECHLSKMPASNRVFWETKLARNRERDVHVQIAVVSMGWRVALVWECALRGKAALGRFESSMDQLADWIRNRPSVPVFELTSSSHAEIC